MALLPWQEGTILAIEDAATNTKRFWIRAEQMTEFHFTPGQFVTLDLPIDEKPGKRWRSYSIASHPDGSNIFELVIVLNPFGKGTPYLFNEVKVGDHLTFRGPLGVFTIPTLLDKPLFLVCTGTGIAPFRSMVHYIHQQNLPHQGVYLLAGHRHRHNLLYHDEMLRLQQEFQGFEYHPVLSREEWEGHSGYVHQVYSNILNGSTDARFMLCGWKNMVDEAKTHLIGMGFDKKHIHSELYG